MARFCGMADLQPRLDKERQTPQDQREVPRARLRGDRRLIRIMACSGWKKRNRPPFPVERTAGYATSSTRSSGVLMRDHPARTRPQRIRSRIYLTLLNCTIIQRSQPECNRLHLPSGPIYHRKVGCNATVMMEVGLCVRPGAHFRYLATPWTASHPPPPWRPGRK